MIQFLILKLAYQLYQSAYQVKKELQINLKYKDQCEPLPKWVHSDQTSNLKRFSMLENFSSYIMIKSTEFIRILEEVNSVQFYYPRGQPKYSTPLILFNEFSVLIAPLAMVPYLQIVSSLLMKCICKKAFNIIVEIM